MKTMISREVKRLNKYKQCDHDYTRKPVKDPIDKRRILKPYRSDAFGMWGWFEACAKCGTWRFVAD